MTAPVRVGSLARGLPSSGWGHYDLKTSGPDCDDGWEWVLQVLDANNQRIRFNVIKE
ncbi:MAG: hypothetical protein MZU91_09560 [Desulfosudis oleivorans]|nr:hypothetical protein [Desulfosudis oleivorans]